MSSCTTSQLSKVDGMTDALKHEDVQLEDRRALAQAEPKLGGLRGLLKDPKILGIASIASFGVVGNVLVLESFAALFPAIYVDSGRKGWFVSTLLLAAWAGSLINGPFCDKFGRKRCIMFHLILFLLGGALQSGATSEGYLFGGRAVAGLSIGALTHIIPMYIAELSPAHLRGSLVALQQLAITLGTLFSYWIAYGTSHIGSTRCAPDVPYTGPLLNGNPTFDAYNDVPAGGCDGQSDASFRIPLGFQLLPALILSGAMFFMPYSPRWLVEVGRDEEAKETLARIRSSPSGSPEVMAEYIDIKAEVAIERQIRLEQAKGQGGLAGYVRPYAELFSSRSNFHRLAIGSLVMFYQQFIGCNAIIYYAPTIFAQLGLDPNTTSLLATGVYGITNTVFTLPAVFFLDSVGRRPLLMAGAVGCFISLVMVGSLIAAYGDDWPAHQTAGRVAIAFVYIYDVNFSYSWAPIGWVLPSEIFNLSTRSTGTSITTSSTWMNNFIIGLVSPMMLENLAHGGTYFFFAAFAVLGFFTVFFFLPETRLKTLEEMDALFGAQVSTREREITHEVRKELGLGLASPSSRSLGEDRV